MNPDSFICFHAVDRSLLAQGFTLPGAMLVDFTSWSGPLTLGTIAAGVLSFTAVQINFGNYIVDLKKRFLPKS